MSDTSDGSPDLWQKIRYHVYAVYEKSQDIDRALSVMHQYKLGPLYPRFRAGLKAELIFYAGERTSLGLEPLLDAGVKADFTGTRRRRAVNIDVTTNLAYKDIDDYAELTTKRGKLYLIASVNIKTEEYELFPLRFPICEDCDNFSHYILFMERPEGGTHFFASQVQVVVRHCPYCATFDELDDYSYIVDSPLYQLREIEAEQLEPETANPSFERESFLRNESIPIVRFFEKIDKRLLSGLAEMDYVVYGSDGEGDLEGILLWHHPLVRNLDDELDYSI